MTYRPTWGVESPIQVTSNVELAGMHLSPVEFNDSLFIVDDPANGGPFGQIYDNDFLDSVTGSDTTVSQPNEGFADSDGGPVVAIAELGFLANSVVHVQGGIQIVVPVYAFRLEDGRTILRVDDFALTGFNDSGLTRNDIVGVTLGSAQDYQTLSSIAAFHFDSPFAMICFVDGTQIDTADGPVAVENLRAGDLVRTADHGYQPLRLALSRQVGSVWQMQNPRLRPVRITAGSLGNGLPQRDLRVSRQHRMLVASSICERMFGTPEVLLPAVRLTELPGIFVEDDCAPLVYFHLVFDRHEVIFADGAPAESFFIGRQALDSLTPEARDELLTLFPDAVERCEVALPARAIPTGHRMRGLIARHAKSGKPLAQPRP